MESFMITTPMRGAPAQIVCRDAVHSMASTTTLIVMLALSCFAQSVSARTYALVVSGLGGTSEYAAAFAQSSDNVYSGLSSLESDATLITQLDDTATRIDILDAIDGQAQRIAAEAGSTASEPVFVLVLTGHGNADNSGWRFNVPGEDIGTDDLIAALNSVPAARQLVVLAASASGAALEPLSQLGRVLVTATKSGGEVNAVRFHEYLAEAMQSDVADFDRNEILTIAEAYRFADSRTRDYYEQQNLLASEHSRLRGEEADEIAVALLGSLRDAKDDPEVSSLLDERLVLEQSFKSLKARKPDMAIGDYYDELETLLISIARLQETIDETTGWDGGDADS